MSTQTFDIPSVQKSIDAAIASLRAEDRFNVLLHVDRTAGSAALLVRLSDHVEAVAKVSKPWRDKWEASADVRIHFAMGPAGGIESRGPADSLLVKLFRAYLLFRPPLEHPNSPFRAAVKAVGLVFGASPYLDGRRWFA